MLSNDRREQIMLRVKPLFQQIDPDLLLLDVLLDSTRTQLLFILQKMEWPLVITMEWLDYVSQRDPDLQQRFAAAIQNREEAARTRLAAEKEI